MLLFVVVKSSIGVEFYNLFKRMDMLTRNLITFIYFFATYEIKR